MGILVVTDGNNSLQLDKQQSIDMELKLNVSSKGHTWKHIGDDLYKFGTANKDADNLLVTKEQFEFLLVLQRKASWRDCYGV